MAGHFFLVIFLLFGMLYSFDCAHIENSKNIVEDTKASAEHQEHLVDFKLLYEEYLYRTVEFTVYPYKDAIIDMYNATFAGYRIVDMSGHFKWGETGSGIPLSVDGGIGYDHASVMIEVPPYVYGVIQYNFTLSNLEESAAKSS